MADTDSLERIRKALEACKAASDPSIPAHVYIVCREELENACTPNAIRSLIAREAALREALVEERRLRLLGQEPDVHWESMRDMRRDAYAATDAALASTEPT